MQKKKLILNRETLKVLSPTDARKVQGGRPVSDNTGSKCSTGGGTRCTMTCPPPI